jgi:ElaA protein
VIQWSCKHFNELGLAELYALMRLRQIVFSVEQDCAHLDADGADLDAHHILGFEAEELLAYARILKPGARYEQCSIGRVITAPEIRRTGSGRVLMRIALEQCAQLYPCLGVRISAQARLEKFYQSFGFVTDGEPYSEDNIPHLAMSLEAQSLKVHSLKVHSTQIPTHS